jgi:cytochrome c553
MGRMLRIAGYGAGGLAAVLAIAGATVFGASSRHLAKTYPAEVARVAIPTDAESLAWGEHLVKAVTNCQECHGMDLGGQVMIDDPPFAVLAAPNLTAGRGGIGASYRVEDWVRAIRHGTRADGTSLIIMPSYAYAGLSDRDLGAIIGYLERIPPVDRDASARRIGPVGRTLLALGKLDVMVAAKTPQAGSYRAEVNAENPLEYGKYLAGISGCTSCHGADLRGRPPEAPGAPPAPSLTRSGLAGWGEAEFVHALREGRRPDGSEISDFMPWRFAGGMTDAELHAVWLYLQSVPAE